MSFREKEMMEWIYKGKLILKEGSVSMTVSLHIAFFTTGRCAALEK
jgi:hypothetical protein